MGREARALIVALTVGGVPASVGLLGGGPWWLIIGGLVALFAFTGAIHGFHDDLQTAWRPKDRGPMPDRSVIDLDEELEDLMYSAVKAVERRVTSGTRAPFVLYETREGDVKLREVRESDEERWFQRARETARALEDARRLVLVVPGHAQIDGASWRPAMIYEAAEEGVRERTYAFVQPYRPKSRTRGGDASAMLLYAGDGAHTLRWRGSSDTAEEQRARPIA